MKVTLETEHIHNTISRKLSTAQIRIRICVAWFTCKSFSDVLKDRLGSINVDVLISDHEFNHTATHFNLFLRYPKFKLYIMPTIEKKLMHNKFCIIDNSWIVTGSYNWSDKAESNFENIVVIEDSDLANGYNQYFEKLILGLEPINDFRNYILGFTTAETISITEEETKKLAKEFEEQILKNVDISHQYIRVDFERIKDNIQLHSGVGAARIYSNEPIIQSGLRQLKEKGHLELSFEWMVLQPQYAALFSERTRLTARSKLIECHYQFPEHTTDYISHKEKKI